MREEASRREPLSDVVRREPGTYTTKPRAPTPKDKATTSMTSFDFALWSADNAYGKGRLRICFASPSHDELCQGAAVLAQVCRREFGVPARNRQHRAAAAQV